MRIWLITIGEPLPTDAGSVRLLRHGMLADRLADRGHEVLWWSSTFDHYRKSHRFEGDTAVDVRPGYRLELLHSIPYKRNVSLARILNQRALGLKFARRAPDIQRPDLILCSFPTVELSREAIRYGREHGVPVVLDVRDLWPDIFVDLLPGPLRGLGRLAIAGWVAETRAAFAGASAVIGVSEEYLRWGLRYAGRPAGPDDRVFPLGYRRPVVDRAGLDAAREALAQRGVDPSRCICWFVGMFGLTYDLATVIQAAREFARRGEKRLQFVLSGDGEQREAWTRMAEGLDNVVFTGWVDTPQLAAMGSMAGIGLAAYNRGAPQGLPNKLFEYLSAGVPVLSSLTGETERFLAEHECGLSYAAGDPAALVTTVDALLSDESRRKRLGANGSAVFESSYSDEVVYSRMSEYLEEMAVGRPDRNESPASVPALSRTR